MDVTDKVAIVTGSGRGIGRAIAVVLARNGANLVIADINEEDAKAVEEDVEILGSRALPLRVDVTDQSSVDEMVEKALKEFGQIDIVVNNAGIIGTPGWEERMTPNEADWDSIYAVNVKGIAKVTGAVVEHMKAQEYGKIVNIASVAGRRGTRTNFAYGASKAAVINLTKCFALEYASHGINVNCVCPGQVWTKMWERIASRRVGMGIDEGVSPREAFDGFIKTSTPLGRDQTPEEIANTVAFFASDAASGITGQALNVDGGFSMD
jgi:meso-butanediol dehydrogenase/(S,S)-butanediol dehydrogenase/diacetyl reductase